MKGKFLLAASAALVFFSCTEKELETQADTLEVTPASLEFDWKDNEPQTLTVKTNVEDWDYSADGWIDVTVDGETLSVNVTDNQEYEERTGKILVTAGNAKTVRIEVKQAARIQSSLELSQTEFIAKPEGETFEITVTSAEEWSISGSSEWCRMTPDKGVSGDKITVTVDANDTEEARTAKFSIISGTVIKVVTITSNPVLFMELVSPASPEQSFDYMGDDFTVDIRTNLPVDEIKYDITAAGDVLLGWISVDRNPGTSTYKVNVAENTGYEGRQAVVSFSHESMPEPIEITVSQTKCPNVQVFMPTSYEIGSDGQTIYVLMATNLNVTMTKPDWVEQVGEPQVSDRGDGRTQYSYTFNIPASQSSRNGEIVFQYEQYRASVSIKQEGSNVVFADIPDATFREFLTDYDYIIPDGDNSHVEVTAEGQAATSFDFSWGYTRIASIEGIEAFSNLTSINLTSCNTITKVDISGLTKVNSLSLANCSYISEVNLGENPVKMMYFGWETTVYPETVTISSQNLSYLVMSYQSLPMPDTWVSLDITDCPSLSQIDSQRPTPVTIYCTEAQKSSIDNTGNGVLTVRE